MTTEAVRVITFNSKTLAPTQFWMMAIFREKEEEGLFFPIL